MEKLTASDAQASDFFGITVAVSSNTAVVGANLEDAGGPEAGDASMFDLLIPKPTPTVSLLVGGISLDSDLRPLPLETSQPDSSPWAVVAFAAAVFLLALGGVARYARLRRRERGRPVA